MTKHFKVTDYKGINGTIEVSTDGGSVIVQGRNAAGKSSFIDAITELFDAKGVRLTPKPIRDGEDEASAEFIDTDLDVRVVREWKRNEKGEVTSKLSVYALDGAKHSKPSEIIAQLTGGLVFDPVKFLQLEPKPQRDLLLTKVQFSDPDFDLAQLDREQLRAEEDRTAAFQVKQAAIGAVTNAERPAPGTPEEPVSTADLVAELTAAREYNQSRADAEQAVAAARSASARLQDEIADLEARLAEARTKLAAATKEADEVAAKLATMDPPIDLAPIQERVGQVDEINRNVQLAKQLRRLEQERDEKIAAHDDAVEYVESFVQRKKAALAKAIFPDPHLSVDDGQVLYDGVPFSQVNTAARNKAAFSIATSGDPELKLVIVKDGDLLDENSLAEIDRVTTERGFTTLIERGRPDVGGLVATFVELNDGRTS